MKLTDATKEELIEYFLDPHRVSYQGCTVKERDWRFLTWLYNKRNQALLDELDELREEENTTYKAYQEKYKEFIEEKDPVKKFELCQAALDISLKLKRLEGRWEATNKKIEKLD